MKANDQRVARILQSAGLLDDGQLRAIDSWQQQWGGKVHQIAVDRGFTSEAQVAAALANGLNLPRVELATTPVEPDALRLLDRAFCEANAVIPVALRDNGATLWAAVNDPTDLALLDLIRARARVARVMPGVAGCGEILDAVHRHYSGAAVGVDANDGIELERGRGDEEFKVTNIAGSTLVKHEPGLEQLRAELNPPPAPDTYATQIDPRSFYIGSTDPVADPAAPYVPAATDGARLETIKKGLAQSTRALQAVVELCLRHGIFSDAELRARSGDI